MIILSTCSIQGVSSESKKENSKIGMPTSCKDLQLLGHKLDGFYSVKSSHPNKQRSKIETVYCDFPSSSTPLERSSHGIINID